MRISALLLVLIAMPTASTAPRQHKTVRQLPDPVRLSEEVLLASAIRKVEPAYPRLARAARISGSVPVEVNSSTDLSRCLASIALTGKVVDDRTGARLCLLIEVDGCSCKTSGTF